MSLFIEKSPGRLKKLVTPLINNERIYYFLKPTFNVNITFPPFKHLTKTINLRERFAAAYQGRTVGKKLKKVTKNKIF